MTGVADVKEWLLIASVTVGWNANIEITNVAISVAMIIKFTLLIVVSSSSQTGLRLRTARLVIFTDITSVDVVAVVCFLIQKTYFCLLSM